MSQNAAAENLALELQNIGYTKYMDVYTYSIVGISYSIVSVYEKIK